MSKNLKELVLHQIYDVITNKKYEEISTFGEMIGLENLHTSAGTEFKSNAVIDNNVKRL